MKLVHKIDKNGLFVEDVFANEDDIAKDDLLIEIQPIGFYTPKWNNELGVWEEGKLDTEINEIKAEMDLSYKIFEAKEYLKKTDHKMFNNYQPKEDENLDEIISLRNENRQFIRDNK